MVAVVAVAGAVLTLTLTLGRVRPAFASGAAPAGAAGKDQAAGGSSASAGAGTAKGDAAKGDVAKGDAAKGDTAKGDAAKMQASPANAAGKGDARTRTRSATNHAERSVTADGARTATSSGRKKGADRPEDQDSPGSPPPLDISGLRAEIRREAPPAVGIDPPELPETKVEKMLGEVAKAREALHDDTRKLEALIAQDSEPGAEGGAAAPGTGKPAKNPLDILAKALRGIKPDQAAPIVTRIDKHLGATVLQRMPPVDAGKILAAMKPDAAAELATLIALRRPAADTRPEVKR